MHRGVLHATALSLAFIIVAGCGKRADSGPETVPLKAKVIMTKGGTAADLANAGVIVQFESVDQPGTIGFAAILEDDSLIAATQTPAGEKRGLVPGTHRVRLNADERAAQKFAPRFLKYETSGLSIKVPSEQPIEIKVWK